jgi:phage terminase small subunit
MGKRGPRPKPTHLKVVEGRKGAKQKEAKEPRPRPPTQKASRPWDTLTAAEKRHYDRALRELLPMGHVGEVDLATLTLWAKAFEAALVAFRDVNKRGQTIGAARSRAAGGSGERVRNPSVQTARDYAALAKGLAAELGMTPAGRVGIASTGKGIPTDLASLLGDVPAGER